MTAPMSGHIVATALHHYAGLNLWRREQGYTGPKTQDPDRHGEPVEGESPQAGIACLEAQVRWLESDKQMLATERDILRKAAKYFAGETNW